MLFWWIDAACASEMGNQWITFFFIAMCFTLYEVLYSFALVCLWLCLGESFTCLPVGGRLEGCVVV
jgi:hypothetical protein